METHREESRTRGRRAVRLLWAGLILGLLPRPVAGQPALLWSARYDSGGDDSLGAGSPFRVEGSGAVTLAGQSGSAFLLVRFLPDGTFDQARLQTPTPAFVGSAVGLDSEGRALWAGYPAIYPVNLSIALLLRLAFAGDPETLYYHSITDPGFEFAYGVSVAPTLDGGVVLGYNRTGHFGSVAEYVTKVGGTGSWFVADAALGMWSVPLLAPDAWGGAIVGGKSIRPLKSIDRLGSVVWSRSTTDADWAFEGAPIVVAVDGNGNALACGESTSSDFLLLKIDPVGAEVWRRSFDGSGHARDIPAALTQDVAGGIYLTGSSVGAAGNSDYATVKYDAAGNLLWARIYDSGGIDTPAGIAVDAAGNAWVTGVSGSDVFTIKYDLSGSPVFSHRFASPGPPTVSGVALDSWGNATVAFSAAGDIFALRYGEAPTKVGPLSFQTLDPCRAFDSRDPALGGPNPLAGPSDHTVPLAGVCGVPSTAKAVSLNVTAVGSTAPGNLVLFPAGQTAPLTSAINYSAGQTRANNGTVGLGPDASLALRVNQGGGTVHVLVDVVGYWQ